MGGLPMDIDRIPDGVNLMSAPPADLEAPPPIARATTRYENTGQRFRLREKAYGQYAQSYFVRLTAMRPLLLQCAAKEFPEIPVHGILNLPEGQECVVIGTAYKEMRLKPNILDEYVRERGVANAVSSGKLTAGNDVLILEDEKARMVLRAADSLAGRIVTGVAILVKGSAAPGGNFIASDWRPAGLPPQPQRAPSGDGAAPGGRKYVALASGLGVGGAGGEPLAVALLVDWLTGLLGGPGDQAQAAKVARLVVAGGLMHRAAGEALAAPTTHASFRAANTVLQPVREMDMTLTQLAAGCREMDMTLTQLAAGLPVDVMPGAGDPASAALPQQPLHRCLFPGAASFATFAPVTNPHEFAVDGVRFLGTSGQNVDDVWKYSDIEARLDIMEALLSWRHLAPTAPDTLAAIPLSESDPFIIKSCPSVLFAGCQPAYATRLVTGPDGQEVRLIAVPEFRKTGVAVLVDVDTLEPQPLHFDACLS